MFVSTPGTNVVFRLGLSGNVPPLPVITVDVDTPETDVLGTRRIAIAPIAVVDAIVNSIVASTSGAGFVTRSDPVPVPYAPMATTPASATLAVKVQSPGIFRPGRTFEPSPGVLRAALS